MKDHGTVLSLSTEDCHPEGPRSVCIPSDFFDVDPCRPFETGKWSICLSGTLSEVYGCEKDQKQVVL